MSDITDRSGTSASRRSNPGRPLKSSTYEDNFNFAVSFYQPMIDYLDKKVSDGGAGSGSLSNNNRKEPFALPRLRFLEEQSLQQKRVGGGEGTYTANKNNTATNSYSTKPIQRSYTERDLKTLIQAAEIDKENSSKRTADEVSGASGSSTGRIRNIPYGSRGRTVTFINDNSRSGEMSSLLKPSSSTSALLSLSSSSTSTSIPSTSFPSGVKLGVSKSTLSSGPGTSSSSSSNTIAPTPTSDYSLTKESIKASLLSKSAVVDEISSKLAESKRRFAEEKERECKKLMGKTANSTTIGFFNDEEQSSPLYGLQRSHSFGAFTKKAKRDVQDQIAFNSVVQQQRQSQRFLTSAAATATATAGLNRSKAQAPQTPLARSISKALAINPSSITELHSPVSLLRRSSKSSKNVRFTTSAPANDVMVEDDSRVDAGVGIRGGVVDSNAAFHSQQLNFNVILDDTRNDDVEYWKDLW